MQRCGALRLGLSGESLETSRRASERARERARESCDSSTKQKQLLGDKEVDAASQVRGQRSEVSRCSAQDTQPWIQHGSAAKW